MHVVCSLPLKAHCEWGSVRTYNIHISLEEMLKGTHGLFPLPSSSAPCTFDHIPL